MPKDLICGEFSLHFVATEVVCLLTLVCKKAAVGAEGSTCPCAQTASVWDQTASCWPLRDIGLRNRAQDRKSGLYFSSFNSLVCLS